MAALYSTENFKFSYSPALKPPVCIVFQRFGLDKGVPKHFILRIEVVSCIIR